jgi:unsaturated rhamnogalacturonyl hydrolase
MKIVFHEEEIIDIIEKVVRKTMTMDLTWDWPCGVAYYGITRAYGATGNKEYLNILKQWTDEYIELGLPEWSINTCAMGHMLNTLYEETGDSKYWEIVISKLDFLRKKAVRFGDNVLVHLGFEEQAWADTLFMAAFFMLRAGIKLKDQDLIQDALNQYYWHIKYLQDPKTGFWYHGYDNIQQDHMSGFFWGRANAWAAYSMSQIKSILPEWYLYPQCMDIECSLRDLLAALKYVQTENGLWRTLVNDDESYEEVSASCGIAAAMVNNRNPLHTKYIQKALDGILANISEDGRVLNVSGGTAVMKDREGYCNIPKVWMQGWGQGLALAFLSALIQ